MQLLRTYKKGGSAPGNNTGGQAKPPQKAEPFEASVPTLKMEGATKAPVTIGPGKNKKDQQGLPSAKTNTRSCRRVVFAWGIFDLVRAGDIEYLKKARALGDFLVVGVYSDAVVARLYDKTRPMTPQKERMEILSSFAAVDRVILLTEGSPIHKIKKIAPDIVASCDLVDDPELTAAVNRMNRKWVKIKLRAGETATDIIQKIRTSFSTHLHVPSL